MFSSGLSWLDHVRSMFLRRPVLLAIAFLALYGIRRADVLDFSLLTSDPFVTLPNPTHQFLHSSPLTIFIGWPITRLFGAGISSWIVSIGGLTALICVTIAYLRHLPLDQRAVALLVVFSTPILMVLTRWVGKGDPYILALFLLTLDHRRGWAIHGLLCAVLVLAHKELGTIVLIVDALMRWRLRPATVAGLVAGNALVSVYLASLSVAPMSRVNLAVHYLTEGAVGWAHNPVAHLILTFGWFWCFLFVRRREPDALRVAIAVALCLALSFDGADYTRVFVLCTFPIVVYTAEAIARAPASSRLVATSPFPLAFLIQMQVESFDHITDTSWPFIVHHVSSFLQRS